MLSFCDVLETKISLIPEINKQVHVCDAYKRYKKLNILGDSLIPLII